MNAKRASRLIGLAALLGALGAPRAWAAGPKVSSASVIVDDLLNGAAGSVQASGGGATLDGGLGQLAAGLGTASGNDLESGYFSLLVSTPNSPAASEVDGSSVAFSWSDAVPPNGTGTAYVVDMSTDSGFGGALLSSSVVALSGAVTGLKGNTTYYSRIRAAYSEGDDSGFVNMGQTVTQALAPASGLIFDAAPFTLRALWDPLSNTVGEPSGTWSTLTAASNLPAVRQAAAMAFYGGRLYLSGGADPAVQSTVFVASVSASGALGPWTAATPLPAPRESHAMAAWGGRLYVAGGSDGTPRATVWWAPILADGSLGGWTATASLPAARTKLAMTAWAGGLVATGGDDGAGAKSTVYYAALNDDGSISAWNTSANSLPAAVSGHAMAVSSGTLYAAGGVGAGVSSAVWWTPLTGAVPGAWTATTPLPVALKFHAMAALNGKLFVTGGSDGSTVQSTTYVAQLSTDATVAQWTAAAPLAGARYLHAMAASMDALYAVGGSDGSSLLSSALSTTLSGTQYDAEISTSSSFATLNDSSGWRSGAAFDYPGLTPNTVYYGRVRARNYAGVTTSYLAFGSTMTLAAVPATAASTFTAISSAALSFQWQSGGNPAGTEYLAQASTAADFTGSVFTSGWLTSTTTGFAGLSVNTSYYLRARARNAALAASPYAALGSTFTLAEPPNNSTVTAASASGLTLTWTSTANPAGTWFEAQVSSAVSFVPILQSSVTQAFSASFSSLIGASTFYARVRALNGDGVPSGFDAAVSTTTGLDSVPPGVATGTFAYPSGAADGLTAGWVSPGDDGSSGTLLAGASFYLQWSTSDPAGVAWSTSAAQVVIATGPIAAGAIAATGVGRLPDAKEVFFRVWTQDFAGNFSAPSATFSAVTTPFSFESIEGGGGFDAGSSPTLAADRAGNLHAAYRGTTGTQELRYAKRTGGAWSVPVTVDAGVVVSDLVLALDPSGNPVVAYRDASAPALKVARFNGSWSVSTVESGNFTPGGAAVEASGAIDLSYYDEAAGRLKYARLEGVAWSTQTVDNGPADTGRESSLALDAFQQPHISYYDATNMALKYASATASVGWSLSTVDPGVGVGTACAIAMDGFSRAHIVYGDASALDVKYASETASGWSVRAVESVGSIGGLRLGLALDGAGAPSVSYSDRGSAVLKYARWTGSAFSTQTVDASADDGVESSLALDGSGNAHILYRDATTKSLKAAHWTGAGLPAPLAGNARGRAGGPTGMTGSVVSVSTLQWSWTDNSSNELGFALFGALNSTGPYTLIADSATLTASAGAGGVKTYLETGLSAGTTYYRYAVAVGSGGVVASGVASAVPASTTDVAPPSIVNNQLGDATKRRTNNGLYNVNFYDAGGSHLSNFSVRASTVPGGAGPDLIAYTPVLGSAINADAYTATWPLPAAVFNALLGGVTNYITIQVSDFAGNVSTGTDLFYVLRDTTVPTISGHVVEVSSQGITAVEVDCYDESGTLQATAFTQADGSGTYVLSGMPLTSTYRVQATWSVDGVGNSVSIDSIPVDATNLDFVLQLNYTLATLQGTLQTLSTPQGTQAALGVGTRAAFFDPKAIPNQTVARVELFQGNRQVAMVPVPNGGHWVIPNLLPGRYSVRAYNGVDYTELQTVDLIDGEVRSIGFLSSPLPNEQVFAYPNPARFSTTFRFQSALIPVEADIRVFDLAGRLVKELTTANGGVTSASGSGVGVYHADWDLTNTRGEAVASGVYLFSVKVSGGNGQTALVTKKLAVVR